MKLSEIKIPNKFSRSNPNSEKLHSVISHLKATQKLDKSIILSGNTLVDGYIRYLALKELGYEETDQIIYRSNIYVWGKHLYSECKKEFVWRLPQDIEIEIGDHLLARTKYGAAPIVVTKFSELTQPPVKGNIKSIIGKVGDLNN